VKIGFTGTRTGLTTAQRVALRQALSWSGRDDELHHGDCVGSDFEAATMATALGLRTVAHPPLVDTLRGFHRSTEVRDRLDYLPRDRQIVRDTERLLACPKERDPVTRSGTWYTVRYAASLRRPVLVVNPDGTLARRGVWPS
jgi:hypothetical protein